MDWISIITDLQAAGFSQQQIATTCGCSQATVSELRTNQIKQPSHPLGEALKALHKKTFRKIKAIETPCLVPDGVSAAETTV